ncbi:hypothetical protein DI43_14165 [Geobacillus sp. CAMR12739]|nr:hypothetical protein DI43_14165 [Geobacillus sp. CAMR12739]
MVLRVERRVERKNQRDDPKNEPKRHEHHTMFFSKQKNCREVQEKIHRLASSRLKVPNPGGEDGWIAERAFRNR